MVVEVSSGRVVVDVEVVVVDVVVVGSVVVVEVDEVVDVVVVGVLCQADARSGKKLNRIAGRGISQWL